MVRHYTSHKFHWSKKKRSFSLCISSLSLTGRTTARVPDASFEVRPLKYISLSTLLQSYLQAITPPNYIEKHIFVRLRELQRYNYKSDVQTSNIHLPSI